MAMLSTVVVLQVLNLQLFLFTCAYNVEPLKLGAEIFNINLQKEVPNTLLFEKLKSEAHRHRLLIFRNQGVLPADTLVKISEHFGEPYREPYITQTKNHSVMHKKLPSPAVMRISNDVNEGYKGLGTTGWHSDGTYRDVPYSFLVFNSVKASLRGDTKFIGYREVLNSLDHHTLKKWDKLWTVTTRTVLGKKVYATHPLLFNHPVTNETTICVHVGYMVSAIYNYDTPNERYMTARETMALRTEMALKLGQSMVYSHRWQEGDVVIIDNLQIAHMASKESQMSVDKVGLRVLHRIVIQGEHRPQKRQLVF